MAPLDVFPVSWSVGDTGPGGACRITAFGKTPEGQVACVHVRFTPWFYVEMPAGRSEAMCRPLMAKWAKTLDLILDRCKFVRRASLWGYRGGKTGLFAQLVFPSLEAFRQGRRAVAGEKLDTYEASTDPVVRLFHLRNIGPCRWMRVQRHAPPAMLVADVDLEVECGYADVGASPITSRPPLVFGSWDIECYSASGGFPVGSNPADQLIQISTAFQRYGEAEPYHRSVVCLDRTADVDGVQIVWTPKEHRVIELWADLLREHKVDVLIGWNTSQFDFGYLSARCGVLVDDATGEPLVNTELLGRMVEGGGEPREFELNSGAYGQNKFFVMGTPGVQQIDLLQYVRREYKLASYSLDNVSKHFLAASKLDLPAAEIFRKFKGTPEDRADIARYAVRDTELPLKLLAKLGAWENLAEMANAVNVPMDYLLVRGQQIKVYSVILGKAREMGYLIPDNKGIGLPPGTKYEGATVLDAKRGAYFDVVTGLDFASLVSLKFPTAFCTAAPCTPPPGWRPRSPWPRPGWRPGRSWGSP